MSMGRLHKRVVMLLVVLAVAFQAMAGGLNVVIFGDSNSWLGGDGCNKEKGWTKWFVDDFAPASCRSYARSGATWTHTANTCENLEENIEVLGDNNVVYNQIKRAQRDVKMGGLPNPDLVIIAAGTNDVWFAKKRPQALTSDALEAMSLDLSSQGDINRLTSLTRVVDHDVTMLRESFPRATIVLLTPMQSIRFKNEDVSRAGDLIELAASHRKGVYVIRLDKESAVKRATELKKKRYTTDGVHTSVAGARSNGQLVSSKVKQILNIMQ